MAPDPVPVVPMSPNPFPVAIVVAFDPDLAAMRVGANIKGCEEGQKRQADTKNQQFHFQLLKILVFRRQRVGPRGEASPFCCQTTL